MIFDVIFWTIKWIIIPAVLFEIVRRTDWKEFLVKLIKWLSNKRLYRILEGGLWIKFTNGEWSKCHWTYKDAGYIRNPHTGGIFHRSFNAIVKVEEYPWGKSNVTEKISYKMDRRRNQED